MLLAIDASAAAQGIEWRAPAAPSDDDVARGRAAYGRGLEALDRDAPDAALIEFRLSYSLSGAAAALFNAAYALTRLGRYVEARAALDALDAAEVPAEVRASAEELSREVDASLASLRVVDIPDGAAVRIDGRPVDGAPILEEQVDPGAHEVRVLRPPSPPFRWQGSLVAGERRTIAVSFTTPPPIDATPGGDDGAGVAIGVIVACAALLAGGVILGVVLDEQAQLMGDAPHVIELP